MVGTKTSYVMVKSPPTREGDQAIRGRPLKRFMDVVRVVMLAVGEVEEDAEDQRR